MALPKAVVERDVGFDDFEAAVAEARFARPLVLAWIYADRLEEKKKQEMVNFYKSIKVLEAIKRNILPHPKKRSNSNYQKPIEWGSSTIW